MRRTFRAFILCLAALPVLSAGAAGAAEDAETGAEAEAPPATADEAPSSPPENARCTPDGRHCIRLESYFGDVCAVIASAADLHGLEAGFLARLLWKESLFDASAVSPKGAQGIAQFMPGTARLRGLEDPFNPAASIFASAEYLGELVARFGNPGLAAAAYNGGEYRVERFLADPGFRLPWETLGYVSAITGAPASDWRDAPPETVDYRLDGDTPFAEACAARASGRDIRDFSDPVPPWGVVVATARRLGAAEGLAGRIANRSRGMLDAEALRVVRSRTPGMGRRARYTVQAAAETRGEAIGLCRQLRARGVVCRVQRN